MVFCYHSLSNYKCIFLLYVWILCIYGHIHIPNVTHNSWSNNSDFICNQLSAITNSAVTNKSIYSFCVRDSLGHVSIKWKSEWQSVNNLYFTKYGWFAHLNGSFLLPSSSSTWDFLLYISQPKQYHLGTQFRTIWRCQMDLIVSMYTYLIISENSYVLQ